MKKNIFWRAIPLVLALALLAGTIWAVYNQQAIIDRFVVASYQPTQEVNDIVDNIQLTDDGKFYFFAAQPEINNREQFRDNCSNRDKESIILGCYVSPQHIFIFDIDDDRLTGVKEVTSAHEMLHVAYDRLSSSEKQRVNGLLEEELAKITDEKLQQRLSVYERTEPGEKFNELHSIIGTEILSLSPELESYYSKYFINRKAVAEMAVQYERLFRELQQQQDGLGLELEQLVTELNRRIGSYNTEVNELSEDISDFNQKARSNYFESEVEFNIARQQLMARQDELDGERNAIEQLEQIYEQKRAQLEALNSEAESLNRTLDSSLDPAPSI